jgi:hypothetical protein
MPASNRSAPTPQPNTWKDVAVMHLTHARPHGDTSIPHARVLRDAATYLDTYGWTRGGLYLDHHTNHPAATIHGAVYLAVTGRTVDPDIDELSTEQTTAVTNTIARLAIAITTLTGQPMRADTDAIVAAWNDHPSRTTRQVVALLRQVADFIDRAEAYLAAHDTRATLRGAA